MDLIYPKRNLYGCAINKEAVFRQTLTVTIRMQLKSIVGLILWLAVCLSLTFATKSHQDKGLVCPTSRLSLAGIKDTLYLNLSTEFCTISTVLILGAIGWYMFIVRKFERNRDVSKIELDWYLTFTPGNDYLEAIKIKLLLSVFIGGLFMVAAIFIQKNYNIKYELSLQEEDESNGKIVPEEIKIKRLYADANYADQVLGLVHAICVSPVAWYVFARRLIGKNTPVNDGDHKSWYGYFMTISGGYFLYDFARVTIYIKLHGYIYFVHSICGLTLSFLGIFGFNQEECVTLLVVETSTILYDIMELKKRHSRIHGKKDSLIGISISFAFTFFLTRILILPILMKNLIQNLAENYDVLALPYIREINSMGICISTANAIIYTTICANSFVGLMMNLFWATKIAFKIKESICRPKKLIKQV
jgi:hypothetical protein